MTTKKSVTIVKRPIECSASMATGAPEISEESKRDMGRGSNTKDRG